MHEIISSEQAVIDRVVSGVYRDIPMMQVGIIRSGTTMMWQILNRIFPGTVKKHKFENTRRFIVATYRDFRDIMVSIYRKHNDIDFSKFDELPQMNEKAVVQYCQFTIDRMTPIYSYSQNYEYPQILWMRYEDFFCKFDYIYDNIEKWQNIQITQYLRKEIEKDFNIEENKRRMKQTRDMGKKWDKGSRIFANHIYNGEIGVWEKLVPYNYYYIIDNMMGEHLQNWGYDLCI